MLISGKNVAKEVLSKNVNVKNIYIKEGFNDIELLEIIKKNKFNIKIKSLEIMNKMVKEKHQGIILEIDNIQFKTLNDIAKDKNSNFIVILDHIEDPRNYGAIIRTCECAGVNYIIVPNKRNAIITETVFKTSAGSVIYEPICKVSNLKNAINKLKELGYWIIGTDSHGTLYTELDYNGKIAVIIGNEGKGLTPIVKKSCDFIASIPLKGKINSLNASVAAGIIIYEILKSK